MEAIILIFRQILPIYDRYWTPFNKIFANRSNNFNFLFRQILPIYDRCLAPFNKIFANQNDNFNFSSNSVRLPSTKSLRVEAIILIFYQILVYNRYSTSFDKIFASRSDNFNFSPARKKLSITRIFPSNEIKNLSSSREDLRYPPISPYFKLASWFSKRRKKKSNGILSR